MKRFSIKRITALVLALIMTLSLCPVTAMAEEISAFAQQEGEFVIGEPVSVSISEEELGYTDEEAFAAYAEREFNEALGIDAPAMWSTSVLEEGTYGAIIYEKLKPMLSATANGEVETTEFEVSLDSPIWTTNDELSLFYDDLALVFNCLLADCPLELYWCDKTSMQYSPIWEIHDDGLKVIGAYFGLFVSADYSASGETGTYAIDTEKTDAVSTTVENAVAIVEKHANKGNYEKLEAYRDEICALVSYNKDAANDENPVYGNPWQMIWVFDEDPDTKVVCEGYSKAFQYLCNLSTFKTSDSLYPIECHTVYGDVDFRDGTGGPHMWNVVTMDDGNNYLVDLTNCDTGYYGSGSYGSDDLFIVPAAGALWEKDFKAFHEDDDHYLPTYTIAVGDGRIYDYGYDPEIETMFGAACDLSQTAYEEPVEPVIEAQWGVAKNDGTSPNEDDWVDSGTMEQARKYANKLESGSTAYIRLLSDIEVAGGLHFASGKETILDLNGKTIDRNLTAALDNGSVIFISGDLTICDTSTNKNGMLTGAYTNGAGAIVLNDGSAFTLTSGNISGNNAPGVTVWGTSEFNMTGGTISGNTAPYSGGGVVVEGTFNMSGGTISGNTANEGGGVCNYGTFTMTDGTISENTAERDGGGVYNYGNGTFTMTNGEISGNTAIGYGGGGVYIGEDSTLSMTGGAITGNTAPFGGGVYNLFGSFTMENSTISDNSTNFREGFGGGVYACGTDSFTMISGTISGNTAGYNGGGVYLDGTSLMEAGTISGNSARTGGGVYISGYSEFDMTGGSISENEGLTGAGVYVEGYLKIDGATKITNNTKENKVNNVFLCNGRTITVSGALKDAAAIGVTTETTPTAGTPVSVAVGNGYSLKQTDVDKFLSDENFVAVCDKYANTILLTEDGVVLPVLTGTSTLNPGDVMVFTDLNGTKLNCDRPKAYVWCEEVYVVCDDADSQTLYLANPSWYTDTFTVTDQNGNPVSMEEVGTMDAADGLRTVYALTVDRPIDGSDQTVSYTMTRTWHDYENEYEVEFTLTFDFAPMLTVKSGAGNDRVKLFSALDARGVLSNDGSISFHNGFLVSCGGETDKTMYVAARAMDTLAVSYEASYGDVPMEHVGTSIIEGYPHRVYAVKATSPSNGDGFIAYRVTCWFPYDKQDPVTGGNMTGMDAVSLRLIFDFYLEHGDLVPFTHNGLRIYGTNEGGTLGYLYPNNYDEMAYNDTVNAVQVPCRPNQDKSIYLVSSKPLSLDPNEENASLTICEGADVTSGYTAYCLTVDGRDSSYRVSVSNGTKTTAFDFWFSSVILNRTSFYTAGWNTGHFSYENLETCDGLTVEEFEGDIVLKVPYTENKEKKLIVFPNDGSSIDTKNIGGGFKKLAQCGQFGDDEGPLPWYGLILSDKASGIGNIVLELTKKDYNGNEYTSTVNILFVPYTVELDTNDFDFNVNLFADAEEHTFALGESLYDITNVAFENDKLNAAFNLVLSDDDSTITIVPATPEDGDWTAWGKACAGTHKSAIKLYYGDGEYCTTEELTFKLTATLPKVSAQTVKFNSFFESDAPEVVFATTANVTGIAVDESKATEKAPACPYWIDKDSFIKEDENGNQLDGFYATLINDELTDGKKGSGKLNLLVTLEGYRAPAQVAVSASAAYTAPQLKLNKTTLSLASRFNDGFSEDLTISCSKDPSIVGHITALEDTSGVFEITSNGSGNGMFTMTVAENQIPVNGKLSLTATIDNNPSQTVTLTMTVKVTSPTLKAKTTKVTLNTALSDMEASDYVSQNVMLELPNVDNYKAWFAGMTADSVQVLDKSGKVTLTNAPNGDLYCVCDTEGSLTIRATKNTVDGTYKVRVTVPGIPKPMDITVTAKATLLKLQLKPNSVSINHALGAGKQKAEIGVNSTDPAFDNNRISVDLGNYGDKLEYEVVGNTIIISTKEADNIVGSYKVNAVYTMPGRQEVRVPFTVKVEDKPPVLKTATNSLSLDVEHGIAVVDVSGLGGSDIWKLEVKKTTGIETVVIDNTTFTVDINDDIPKSGKITVYGCTESGEKTKEITISVKAAALSATASVKGNMDVTRPNTTSSNFTFKYTGWYPGSYVGEYADYAPTLEWKVYAMDGNSKIAGSTDYTYEEGRGSLVASSDDINGWFKDVNTDDYGVSLVINAEDGSAWANGKINPKYTYNVYFTLDFDGVEVPFSKAVKMTVKQGSVKFAANVKAVDLYKADADSIATFSINGTDKDAEKVAAIDRVELVSGTLANQLDLTDNGDSYTLSWKAGVDLSKAKSSTIKLNIWLEGNNGVKANATVSLKVTVQ